MPNTKSILERESKVIWPPYTQARAYFSSEHPVIERGDGVFLFDTEGRRYYDMISSWWVNLHGHNHKGLNQAAIAQLEKVAHCAMAGMTHEPAVRLAEALVAIAPKGISRVFYSDDGSTAVEVAMKMAFQYHHNRGDRQRTKFAAFEHAYHGDTLGTVAAGGIDLFHQLFKPALFDVVRMPAPKWLTGSPLVDDDEGFEAMKAVLDPHADTLAAILVEPLVQGAAGMKMYSPAILRRLREYCDEKGILLIDDEVAMAFGRTGKVWACEHAGITPDIMCAAKGLTAGYVPLAVTLAKESVYEAFLGEPGDTKTFYHGHSFTGNPLGAAIATESLRLLIEERLPALQAQVDALGQALARIGEQPWSVNVRQLGMVGAFELIPPNGSYTHTAPPPEELDPVGGAGRKVAMQAFEEGIYLRPLGDTIYFLPPLSITASEIEDLAARLTRAVEKVLLVK